MKPHWSERSTVWTLKLGTPCPHWSIRYKKKRKPSSWRPDHQSLHHVRLVFFFKKWHSYSQDAYIHKSKRAELPIFSFYITKLDDSILTEYILCRKCHTDHLVCVCVCVWMLDWYFIIIFFSCIIHCNTNTSIILLGCRCKVLFFWN